MIPISKPDIGPAEEEAVLEVLRSGMLAMGKKTAAFEEAWAAYCGVRHAVLMTNGTVALEAILHALGIGPGDEVITVSFSFNATVSAILRVGATPVMQAGEAMLSIRPDPAVEGVAAHDARLTVGTRVLLARDAPDDEAALPGAEPGSERLRDQVITPQRERLGSVMGHGTPP